MNYYPEGVNSSLCKKFKTIESIKQAIASREIIEGKVVLCDNEHNLHIDLGVVKGIIPRNEGAFGILEGTTRDVALISRVNKMVCFRIMGLHREENGEIVAILSRRNVQLDAMRALDSLEIGDVIEAKVTHLEGFGAFIDVGAGVNSLVPIDMLSVSRISNPSERVYCSQLIRVVLRKREDDKLTFSLKELLGTWMENAKLFKVGETVMGVVRSVESYGVFIELMPNLAGLSEYSNDLTVGQRVSVYIKSIIPEKMKIKLVVVEAFDMEQKPSELVYFVEDRHLDCWNYSPENATKQIETKFF